MSNTQQPVLRLRSWVPSVCQVCGAWPSQTVCGHCQEAFAQNPPRCPRCASSDWAGTSPCRHCWPSPSALDAVWAAVDYSYPWSGLIIRFKFHQEIALASAFAQLMLSQTGAQRRLDTADWLVPMPMTPHRLGQRGYHPAWALTQALRRGGSPAHRPGALSNGLVRLSDGQQQHALSRQARLSNPDLRCVTHPEHATRWLDAHVLLIDDVCTTGASLQAAAQALRQAGAARVSAWVFARTRGSAVEPPL